MLDINYIKEHPVEVKAVMQKRGVALNLDEVLAINEQRLNTLKELEAIRAEQNKISKDIVRLADKARAAAVASAKQLKEKISAKETELREYENQFLALMYQLPNLLTDDVPEGPDESGNQVLRKWGKPIKFSFKPKDHLELGKLLDGIDMERAAKVTGARFYYLKGDLALLQFALIQFTLNELTNPKVIKKIANAVEKGYSAKPFVPVVPPVMIRADAFTKMARLTPQDKDERYYLPQDDLYLVGSAEHTMGAMYMNETILEEQFPLRYLGYSTCLRREAGSYGKDTRGILRVHQFDKLEMESFTLPEHSRQEQDFIIAVQEHLVQALAIPYRVMLICTGDMGAPDARQVDIEMWLPGQDKYRETHTSDLMTDYQTRRLNTKVKRKNKRTELAHTNDATAFAVGRTLIAILENYQNEDGSVNVPKVLQPYLGGKQKLALPGGAGVEAAVVAGTAVDTGAKRKVAAKVAAKRKSSKQ